VTFEREGMLSVWVGSFDSEQDLLAYVEWTYDEDGEAMCPFAIDAGLGWFDHDFQEANYIRSPLTPPHDALAGHSYLESFQDAVAAALEQQDRQTWNSLFLLYDCVYDPGQARPSAACRFRFVGVFRYSQG